jgi:LmbE family N-acetylglucosaminyl deacetylase
MRKTLMVTSMLFVVLLALRCAPGGTAQTAGQITNAAQDPGPDARFKTDILVIVAHPDDETEVTGYLARAIFDQHQRVAAIFGTPGNSGGDTVSNAQAAALGDIRITEAREAMASFGVLHVWCLGGPDTPGQNVLHSLETWNHGNALWQTVRLVRLTRPEVILTWLPDFVAGENHDDHQAAGVIATEAFDMAGDPTVFPEQVAAPDNRLGVSNLAEGLQPWQVKKIYYFSDADNTDFLIGKGPQYSTTDISPSKHTPYYKLAAEEMAYHLTQDDTGQLAKHALATGDFTYFKQPVRLALGKSAVANTSLTGDILEGITPGAIPYVMPRGYRPQARQGVSVELGGPWAFYREFWRAHNLDGVAELLKTPEMSVGNGEQVHIPILIRNDSDEAVEVTLTSVLPARWKELHGTARYPVRPHESYTAHTAYVTASTSKPEWQTLHWTAESGGQAAGDITLRVRTASSGLPQ